MASDRLDTRPDERGYETRTVLSLRTGSKIALLAALPFLGYALYNYLTPLWVPSTNGVFGCGSAHNPPTSDWAKGVCQGVPDAALYRAMISAGVGLLLAVLGVVLFGVNRTEQTRAVREDDDRDQVDGRGERRAAVERRAADDRAADTRAAGRRASGRRSYEDAYEADGEDADDEYGEPETRSDRRR